MKAAKLKDLQTLCKKNIIPSQYHNFYNTLPVQPDCDDVNIQKEDEYE